MAGPRAAGTEVAGGRHDSAAEMPVPDAIDDDARGQRIRRIGDPLGEFETAAAGRLLGQLLPTEDAEEAAAHLVALLPALAAFLDLLVVRFPFGHRISDRDLGQVFKQLGACLGLLGEVLAVLLVLAWLLGRLLALGLGLLDLLFDLPFVVVLVADLRDVGVERLDLVALVAKQPVALRIAGQRHQTVLVLMVFCAGEGETCRGEDAIHRVVIAGRDGVELVVVAAGAAQRQTHERAAHGVDGVLDGQVVVAFGIDAEAPRHRDVAGGDGQVAALRLVLRRQ